MVIISLGVPGKQRSSRTVPPARRRNWMVRSTGPWPMSALPCQVPTRDFMRSNSAEAGFALMAGSAAFSQAAVARRTVAQSEVIVVFIGFISLLLLALSSIRRTGRAGEDIGFWGMKNEKFKVK